MKESIPTPLAGFAGHFHPDARARGASLLSRGGVQILARTPIAVTARAGSLPFYNVHIRLQTTQIQSACGCGMPRGCEHIWAVLLKLAGEEGGLGVLDPAVSDRYRRWKGPLGAISRRIEDTRGGRERTASSRQPLIYVIQPDQGRGDHASVLVGTRPARAGGAPGAFRRLRTEQDLRSIEDETDRSALLMLSGAVEYGYNPPGQYDIPLELSAAILAPLARTGRLFAREPAAGETPAPLTWLDDPYGVVLELAHDEGASFRPVVTVNRGADRIELPAPGIELRGSLLLKDGTLSPLLDPDSRHWIHQLAAHPLGVVRPDELDEFLAAATKTGARISLKVPEDAGLRVVSGAPRARVVFRKPEEAAAGTDLVAELLFDYHETPVRAEDPSATVFLAAERLLVERDVAAEAHWFGELDASSLKLKRTHFDEVVRCVTQKKFAAAVSDLIARGFHVQAEGIVYRQARGFSSVITSSMDWFELAGTVDFDGIEVPFPRILRALRKQERLVDLGNGSFGILPEEWLSRLRLLDDLGTVDGAVLKFGRCQVRLLDELVGSLTSTSFDPAFERAREQIARFEGIGPVEPAEGFRGELRVYQKEGLGWMHFLEQFGFGGCLADDMGLGKTVQVLALLAGKAPVTRPKRGRPPKNPPPVLRRTALVVAPRSLVFNWVEEARRFAPGLKVLEHTGLARSQDPLAFGAHDLVITTYGTLRRDVALLRQVEFDTIVLDEAQAIKNASTDAARAARLLRGKNRLALSGTPIENHLGELVSLMDFLNPGLFGSHPLLTRSAVKSRPQDLELAGMLRGVLRPFLLRRTKAAVAPQLPPRTEQTLHCDLEPAQRAHYDELREHYRARLLSGGGSLSGGEEKLLVLEALLRLRQVACHPALVDKSRTDLPSAKLDTLMESLSEVLEEGHKALVFSQFTSLLALVRERLEQDGVVHEYLDGQTRDRPAHVRRFQEDPSVKVFLISLRAGGLGLNLTAAEYVYILDPWWNPAVEAQAIDRAHRIGQERPVFAYRLVARDTVEERILELQDTKRDLADAILSEEAGPLARLTREDLEMLLG